jgi:hypothetical protein
MSSAPPAVKQQKEFALHALAHDCICIYSSADSAVTSQGNVRYELKTPYRDGTTHVIFEPFDFIAKLAALAPKPQADLTRLHGVLWPNSEHRINVTPAKSGKGGNTPNVKNGTAQESGWQGLFAGKKKLTSKRISKSVRFTLFLSEIWPVY